MDAELALETRLVEMAKDTVMGVVTARQSGNCADAELVIRGYLTDAFEMGATPGLAWSMLFSASTLWVAALIELYAIAHDETPADSIRWFALAHAQGEPE